MNPFRKVSRLPTTKKLLDDAFSRAMKTKRPKGNMPAIKKYRIHEQGRISTAVNVLRARINKIVKEFPSIENMNPFYVDLLELNAGVDKTKLALGRLQGSISALESIEEQINLKMQFAENPKQLEQLRKEAFGRISSVIEQLKPEIKFLSKVRMKMRQIPDFDPHMPCIVVAGAPNAGKSSFVRLASTGKPEIGTYPFTTRNLVFGHRDIGFIKAQFVDTPGLLDRPMEKRNKIEKQALIALKRISDIILFLYDPSDYASISLEEQNRLFNEIKDFFDESRLVIAYNKMDLLSQDAKEKLQEEKPDAYFLSTETREGIDTLLSDLEQQIKDLIKTSKFRGEITAFN